MKFCKQLYVLILSALICHACVEPYEPTLDTSDVNLLVVDGFFDVTRSVATASLTRTLPVNSTAGVPYESGAQVHIEDASGTLHVLAERENGTYEGFVGNGGSAERYRLVINTREGRKYESDFVTAMETPPIDSISWAITDGGVAFYVTTHDPANVSRFYRWKYIETYEYNSDFNSLLRFEDNDIVARPPAESIFTCWQTNESTGIILGSTENLEQSVVNRFPITFISAGSISIRRRYSLLVRQQALTEDAYNYWLKLEKTTEHLGGLFDPLPSEVEGNIHSLSSPEETVIGFFDAGTIRESRIFVSRNELPQDVVGRPPRNQSCVLDTVGLNELDQIHKPSTLLVDGIYATGVGLIGYSTAPIYCADCRTLGGTTARPLFWD